MFRLTDNQLQAEKLKAELKDASAGALCVFEGWVRNHNDGRSVIKLEYEAFALLAQKEAEGIIREAKSRFSILHVLCVHRTGTLKVGDLSVWVGVSCEHRDAAFRACRFIIDEIKSRLPIWKKEHYSDGSSAWINSNSCAAPHIQVVESDFYSRQILLPQVGLTGQEKLKGSRVLVVGAGGLGSSALIYLTAAGVGTIGICEHDVLESSNLNRQVLYGHNNIGSSKSQLAVSRIMELNPFIQVFVHDRCLDLHNIDQIIAGYNVVLDCTDNFASKLLINDTCVKLRIPFVQASVYQYEGQILVYRPESDSACMRCPGPDVIEDGCGGACTEVGVLGAVPGLLGAWQAMEALKLILSLPTALDHNLLLIDLLNCEARKIRRVRSQSCPACSKALGSGPHTVDVLHRSGKQVDVDGLDLRPQPALSAVWNAAPAGNSCIAPTGQHIDTPGSEKRSVAPPAVEANIDALGQADLNYHQLIDIREAIEQKADERTFGTHMPFSSFDSSLLDKQGAYLFFCHRGVRSRILVERLRQEGFANARSVKGGAASVSRALSGASSRCAAAGDRHE